MGELGPFSLISPSLDQVQFGTQLSAEPHTWPARCYFSPFNHVP